MCAFRTRMGAKSQANLLNAVCVDDGSVQIRARFSHFYGMAPFGACGAGIEVPPVAEKDHVIGWFLAVAAHFGIFAAPGGVFIRLTVNHRNLDYSFLSVESQ